MALEIVWTPRAEKGFEKIIKYLLENWTEREAQNFMRDAFRFFDLLSEHPEILEKSGKQKNVHRGSMDKHNILTYRIKPRKKTNRAIKYTPWKTNATVMALAWK